MMIVNAEPVLHRFDRLGRVTCTELVARGASVQQLVACTASDELAVCSTSDAAHTITVYDSTLSVLNQQTFEHDPTTTILMLRCNGKFLFVLASHGLRHTIDVHTLFDLERVKRVELANFDASGGDVPIAHLFATEEKLIVVDGDGRLATMSLTIGNEFGSIVDPWRNRLAFGGGGEKLTGMASPAATSVGFHHAGCVVFLEENSGDRADSDEEALGGGGTTAASSLVWYDDLSGERRHRTELVNVPPSIAFVRQTHAHLIFYDSIGHTVFVKQLPPNPMHTHQNQP